jgi:thiosulfate/3-mercaptopyruvate sulfurtransferase
MTAHTTLIAASTLEELANFVKILDCRAVLGDTEGGHRAYQQSHIPSAQYLSLDADLAGPPGDRGRHPLPEPGQLAARLRALGINDNDQVAVYDDAGGAFAARAWWCLRWLGHEAVAVLDGGLKAWQGPLTDNLDSPEPGDFSIRPTLTRTIGVQELASSLADHSLIDARAQPRFDGREEPIDSIAGHIPGAQCRPFQANLREDGSFTDPQTLAARFPANVEAVVCYCGSGVTAAHNILAMRVAGLPEPMLYPGSWSEWIRSDERPIARDQEGTVIKRAP